MVFNMFLILEENDDREKFCDLYERANANIYIRVYSILKNKQDTEDALQGAWEKVMKNFDKIKNQSYDKRINFVWIVAKNTAIDIYNKRKKVIDIESYDTISGNSTYQVENRAISKIESDIVVTAIGQIDDKYKNTLILKYIYNCTNKEIAEILNITETNVSTRLARGKAMVKDIIKREDNYENS